MFLLVNMAIDVCSSDISSTGISPRISFSYDLKQTDNDHREIRLDTNLLDSGSDFDFCIGSETSVQQLSSADELFSNGKILPIQIKKQEIVTKRQIWRSASLTSSSSSSSTDTKSEKKRLKDLLLMSSDSDLEEKSLSKSFWQFKRSISLNYDRTRSKGLIRSLHFLSRSNSTGSAPNHKPTELHKETHQARKQNSQKQPSVLRKSSSVSGSGTHFPYRSTQKSQLKKGFGAYNRNGVQVSPVLNFPPPSFMSNATVGFFGFGSFFCSGKIKRRTS